MGVKAEAIWGKGHSNYEKGTSESTAVEDWDNTSDLPNSLVTSCGKTRKQQEMVLIDERWGYCSRWVVLRSCDHIYAQSFKLNVVFLLFAAHFSCLSLIHSVASRAKVILYLCALYPDKPVHTSSAVWIHWCINYNVDDMVVYCNALIQMSCHESSFHNQTVLIS